MKGVFRVSKALQASAVVAIGTIVVASGFGFLNRQVVRLNWQDVNLIWKDYRQGSPPIVFSCHVKGSSVEYEVTRGSYHQTGGMPAVTFCQWVSTLEEHLLPALSSSGEGKVDTELQIHHQGNTWNLQIKQNSGISSKRIEELMDQSFPGLETSQILKESHLPSGSSPIDPK